MKIKLLLLITVLTLTSPLVNAAIVDISVETDKPIYQLGEEVMISVIAYNPNPEPVTLTCGFYQSSYIIDGVYDWAEGRSGPAVITYVTIEPDDLATWEHAHGFNEMLEYPLDIGTHSLVGEVLAAELLDTGQSQSLSIEFQVVPEPITALLFGAGMFWIRTRKA